MRVLGYMSLAGSALLVALLIIQWENSGARLGDSWIATADTIVLAILAGSVAIGGIVLIVADLLHQRLLHLAQMAWAQQRNTERSADATAVHTPDASYKAAESSTEERFGG